MMPVVALLGVLAGGGATIAVLAAVGVLGPAADRRPGGGLANGVPTRHFGFAVLVGVIAAVITRWPVAGLAATAGCCYLPRLVGPGAGSADTSRIEAIAAWTEMLRDTLSAAGGLQQSIVATSQVAPAAIQAELLELSDRLTREPLSVALRRFADRLDDPTGDLVVAALLLAADRSPGQLAQQLGALAAQARADVASRLRVEAGRARTRSSVRIITLVTIGFAVGLVLLNPTYVEAYSDAAGQVTLLVVAGLFAGGLAWIGHASRADRPARFLAGGAS